MRVSICAPYLSLQAAVTIRDPSEDCVLRVQLITDRLAVDERGCVVFMLNTSVDGALGLVSEQFPPAGEVVRAATALYYDTA